MIPQKQLGQRLLYQGVVTVIGPGNSADVGPFVLGPGETYGLFVLVQDATAGAEVYGYGYNIALDGSWAELHTAGEAAGSFHLRIYMNSAHTRSFRVLLVAMPAWA